jgi:hypothetical protein
VIPLLLVAAARIAIRIIIFVVIASVIITARLNDISMRCIVRSRATVAARQQQRNGGE